MITRLLSCLAVAFFLVSCQSPDPVWNPDGKTMTDLRSLRLRGNRPSVILSPGVTLYADQILFGGKRHRTGEAEGRVYLEVGPEARYAWMVEHGYAERAAFDCREQWVVLRGQAMLEREKMTQLATEPYTEMEVHWGSLTSDVMVRGPTRTDFAKSNAIPPGVTIGGVVTESSIRPAPRPRWTALKN